jgi:hypothetical protein
VHLIVSFRMTSGRSDLLCCAKVPKDGKVNSLFASNSLKVSRVKSDSESGKGDEEEEDHSSIGREEEDKWSLDRFASRHFGRWTSKTPVRAFATVACLGLTVFGGYGLVRMEDGLRYGGYSFVGCSVYIL